MSNERSPMLIKGQLYLFRGQQLRYSHQPQCGVQHRYVFTDSLGQRKELGAQVVRREVRAIQELSHN